jgi:hypothetical protein
MARVRDPRKGRKMARRMKTFLLVIGLVLVLGVAPALAGKGGNGNGGGGGKLTATIDMMDGATTAAATTEGTHDVMFDVTRSKLDTKDTIWVTNKCYDADGNMLSQRDFAVIWGTWDSYDGYAGPFGAEGVTCTAYVTLRPWQGKVLGNAIITYTP